MSIGQSSFRCSAKMAPMWHDLIKVLCKKDFNLMVSEEKGNKQLKLDCKILILMVKETQPQVREDR